MGKKRKSSLQSSSAGLKAFDPADARLAITSFEDVADSEDEYFLNRDRINFDSQPKTKRQKREEEEDALLGESEEEILGADESDDTDELDDDDRQGSRPGTAKKETTGNKNKEDGYDVAEEGDSGWWGSSKQQYYNADAIETEADALEEEEEAKRLQTKKLAKMTDEDFLFDKGAWAVPAADEPEGDAVVTEVLKDVVVTDDMSADERYGILQARYPEFDYLADEIRDMQSLACQAQQEAQGKPSKSLDVARYWVLSCYIAALASYFAIMTSPARDSDNSAPITSVNPTELRDHEVMETLIRCRMAWSRVQAMKPRDALSAKLDTMSPPEEGDLCTDDSPSVIKPEKVVAKKPKKTEKEAEVDEIMVGLDDLIKKPASSSWSAAKSKTKTSHVVEAEEDDNRSDFGEEEEMDAKSAAAKDKRKKSLRFYTSQIVQKAARRADASRYAGGDMDIPYRERIKDRQARLMAEAEKRGQKHSKLGAALADNSSGEEDGFDDGQRRAHNDDEDGYYDMVLNRSATKKAVKAARLEALAAASKSDRVVELEEVGDDSKRKITYAIEKNKGLAPNRKKDVRNPRVKKRKKYEQSKKKLASMRPLYKGGEALGGYQGELSGINTRVVKSTRL